MPDIFIPRPRLQHGERSNGVELPRSSDKFIHLSGVLGVGQWNIGRNDIFNTALFVRRVLNVCLLLLSI